MEGASKTCRLGSSLLMRMGLGAFEYSSPFADVPFGCAAAWLIPRRYCLWEENQ
jgi:hypothetical protein